jgi:hypothetical protein
MPKEAKPSFHIAAALDGSQASRSAPYVVTSIRGAMVAGTSRNRAALANASGAPIRPVAEPAKTFRQRAHSAF